VNAFTKFNGEKIMPNLVSPGVSVSIIDESQYAPASAGSVPLVILATAQNKSNAAGTGVAAATTKANANKMYLVTSQRDLVSMYGNPFFYKTAAGTPIQGYELNEYGLLAAYSVLGVSNRCYVVRADIDLASLVGQVGRPSGAPTSGSYWLDTTNTVWGIHTFSSVTGKFTLQAPIVITNEEDVSGGVPLRSIGQAGEYAVVAIQPTGYQPADKQFFYKNTMNDWVEVGSIDWLYSVPTITGTVSSPTLIAGDKFTITVDTTVEEITIPASPTVQLVADLINASDVYPLGITADVTDEKLVIYSAQEGTNMSFTLANVTGTPLTSMGITVGTKYQPAAVYASNANMPLWSSSQTMPHPTGSVWFKVGSTGTSLTTALAVYNATTGSYTSVNVPQAQTDWEATSSIDSTGGMSIPADSVYAQYGTGSIYLWKRIATGATVVTGNTTNPTLVAGKKLFVKVTSPNSTALSEEKTITLSGTTLTSFIDDWIAAGIPNTTAISTTAKSLQLSHVKGGEILISDVEYPTLPLTGPGVSNGTLALLGLVAGTTDGVKYCQTDSDYVQLTNWRMFDYIANEGAPKKDPTDGTPWFYSVYDQVDIMVNKNGAWKGYRNVAFDSNGHPAAIGTPSTDVNGPIVSASAPEYQSDGTTLLAYGDLWIDTSDLDNYPMISRWQAVDGVDQWVKIDNTDQTSQTGVLFADARWGIADDIDPVNDLIPTITELSTSDYLDLDAPDAQGYPQGMLLFNTRRSGFNVKAFRKNYFNSAKYPDSTLPVSTNAWVTISGNAGNGAAHMGRKAQRAMIVQALKATVASTSDMRDEDSFINLIATPGYPELQPDMVALNNERNNTAYIVGDTPMRLKADATEITSWAQNKANAAGTGEDGLVTRDTYLGVFYPSGMATDLSGASVAVPASHMMLRTFLRNDLVAYPWFAAAGSRRGTIDNATGIGYIDATTGEFQSIKTQQGLRDVLYTNQMNPLAYFTSIGLLNYGNKNSLDSQSAMDRTNVSRLVCYLRERLERVVRPFIFEPNDELTRQQVQSVVQSLLLDINAKRGISDYIVRCDAGNNTPARIDRNELWVDIAIVPIKSVEFIYIPVRILGAGGIASN
jgi:hypothetical protein